MTYKLEVIFIVDIVCTVNVAITLYINTVYEYAMAMY